MFATADVQYDWSPTPASWRERAACRGVDLDVFFPKTHRQEDFDAARMLCRSCPVLDACLRDALETRDFEGFRAGMTGPARERSRRPLREVRCEHCTNWFRPRSRLQVVCESPVCRRARHALRVQRSRVRDLEAEMVRDGLRGVLAELRSGM